MAKTDENMDKDKQNMPPEASGGSLSDKNVEVGSDQAVKEEEASGASTQLGEDVVNTEETGVVQGIENRAVESTMENYFLRYSMSVIIDRALPDVRDGLKPVNRRILYAMNKNGWKAPHATVKSARIM